MRLIKRRLTTGRKYLMVLALGAVLLGSPAAGPAQAWDLVFKDNMEWRYYFDKVQDYGANLAYYQGQVTLPNGNSDWARLIVAVKKETATLIMGDPRNNKVQIDTMFALSASYLKSLELTINTDLEPAGRLYPLGYYLVSGSFGFTTLPDDDAGSGP